MSDSKSQTYKKGPSANQSIKSEPEMLTSIQYQILLKYIRFNPEFLLDPNTYPRTLKLIANDLTSLSESKTEPANPEQVLETFNRWKSQVSGRETASLGNPADRELSRLLAAVQGSLSHSQLTLILQHLEVVGFEGEGLWPTIAVEMRAAKALPNRPEIYWRWAFERWCREARRQYREDQDELSPLQQRYIDYLRDRGEHSDIDTGPDASARKTTGIDALDLVINHCRTCFQTMKIGSPKAYLFERLSTGTTLADKINTCFGTGIDVQERLPKYVCGDCVEKVELSYGLKLQIDRIEDELRHLIAEYNDKENVEESKSRIVEAEPAMEVEIEQEIVSATEEEIGIANEQEIESDIHIPVEETEVHQDDQQQMDELGEEIHPKEEAMEDVEYVDELEEAYEELETESLHEEYIIDDVVEPEDVSKPTYNVQRLSPVPEAPTNQQAPVTDFVKCTQCNLVLRTQELWQKHIACHESERNYECNTCGKRFRSAATLKVHIRTHTDERPYVCEVCARAFRTYSHLKIHRVSHRKDDRPLQCDQCSYSTAVRSSLVIHMRSHAAARPYTCTVCNTGFTTSSNLHKHIRNLHQNLKPFSCELCEKCFTTKEAVQKHLVTHSRTKPYPCPNCSLTYSWYNGLQKHMKSIHPGAPIPKEKAMMNRFGGAGPQSAMSDDGDGKQEK
ncbi:zinc finger protein 76-like [Uranotaenia lowii]|uniref:zinc finger protein 76-like n=1 Tax=Uranotaenia lowii TaxID=190385 RepID=UPI0024795D59|nr:zinc finger protein 76-like [Uranotaenia lowii]